jgi:hypothetical protein
MKSAVEGSYWYAPLFDQKDDEKLALELLCGRTEYDKRGRAKTAYPTGDREQLSRYALSRLLRHYSLDSRAMGGNGLVLHQLSRVLVNDKGMRRRIDFKLKRGRQSDLAADYHVAVWVEIRVRDYGWSVEEAVEEVMEVYGYKDRSAAFDAMKRVKRILGNEIYPLSENAAKKTNDPFARRVSQCLVCFGGNLNTMFCTSSDRLASVKSGCTCWPGVADFSSAGAGGGGFHLRKA